MLLGGAMLQDPDRGDVGERLRRHEVIRRQGTGFGPQEVEGADDLVPQVHRQRVDGGPPGRSGLVGEAGPAPRVPARSRVTGFWSAWVPDERRAGWDQATGPGSPTRAARTGG